MAYFRNSQLASAFVPPQDLNAGLQDQRLALRFIQNEISAFGGDPSKVELRLSSLLTYNNPLFFIRLQYGVRYTFFHPI